MSRKMTSLSSLQPAPRPPWPAPDGAHFSWSQTIDPYGVVTTNQWHKGVCTCCEYSRDGRDFTVAKLYLCLAQTVFNFWTDRGKSEEKMYWQIQRRSGLTAATNSGYHSVHIIPGHPSTHHAQCCIYVFRKNTKNFKKKYGKSISISMTAHRCSHLFSKPRMHGETKCDEKESYLRALWKKQKPCLWFMNTVPFETTCPLNFCVCWF